MDEVSLGPSIQTQSEITLNRIREAIQEYYASLDRRQHGQVAQNAAFNRIEAELGMTWERGATLK